MSALRMKHKAVEISDPAHELGHVAFSVWERAHHAQHGTWPEGWHCRSHSEREQWQAIALAVVMHEPGA